MDYVFEAVDAGYFSFAAFVRAARYEDFVVFADGEGADLGGGGGVLVLCGFGWGELVCVGGWGWGFGGVD